MQMRGLFLGFLLVVSAVTVSSGADELRMAVAIRAQSLSTALQQLARQANLQLVYEADLTAGLQSSEVKGELSVREALEQLLQHTGLRYQFLDERTVAISRAPKIFVASEATRVHLAQAGALRADTASSDAALDRPAAIEEVIVTAQKREENLQDVPIAISVVSGEQLTMRGIDNTLDLKSIAPNLTVSKYPNSNFASQIAIRGGVTVNSAMYWEPSTGMYLDGVYLGKAVGSVFDVVDVERIEVLRGPQGTLYGRNTMAGAVNFITRKPSGKFEGSASIELGNYGARTEKFSLDLPRFGIARMSIAARKEDRDGLVKITGGGELDSRDQLGARFALALDFTDDFMADYRLDYTKIDQAPPFGQLYSVTAQGPLFTAASAYASRDWLETVSTNWPGYERLDLHGHAVTLTWDVNERNQLKSISSRRTLRDDGSFDLDGVPLTIATAKRISDFEQKSQELQWVGRTDRLDYVLGLYYYEDEGYTINPHVFFFGTDSSEYGFGVEAKSAYGQVDWHATDALTLTAGLRRTEEDKITLRFKTVTGVGAPIPRVSAEASFAATTPLATIAYRLNDRMNMYAKYSEGFKSGGFQGEAGNAIEAVIPYGPEEQTTYEVGAKFTSTDGRLLLNAAAFHNHVENMHVNRFTGLPGVSVIRNAGKATVKGFELESVWAPVEALRLQASYGYLDGKWDEFMEAAAPGQPITNVANNRSFPHAPEHTVSVTADARLTRTAWGQLRGLVDYRYTSSFYAYPYQLTTVDPTRATASNTKVEGYGLLNVRLALTELPIGGPGSAELSLWVRNLADEQQPVNFIDFGPGFFADYKLAFYQEPRTYGATFSYRW